MAARTLLAATVVTVAAFLLYHATLLPGQDLGDTASFQATIGTRILTPRQGYPLYYATGNLFTGLHPRDPARAINLASAVFGALACGLVAAVVAILSGGAGAGLVAGLLLAVSYTFWSQAIIAEVYALHAFMMALSCLALLFWAARPSLPRLALFFAIYAVGFGNHLQMILLLPGFALFLLLVAPGGPLAMLRPRVALLAVGMAALGASQYLWNLRTLLSVPDRDPGLLEQLRTFYFDVTKADWRATMVMGIPEGTLHDRFRMYWFDLHQQFGWPGVLLAVAGVAWMLCPGTLWRRGPSRWRVGLALVALFLVNWFFAFTYNVGDAHVFYLPSHFMVALFAGLGSWAVLALAGRLAASAAGGTAPGRWWPAASRAAVAAALVAYPAWRGYDTFPALDRSHDWQVKDFFDRLTAGLDGNNSVMASDLNWQLHNGLDYYARYTRPELAVADTTEALLYFPLLVQSNREIDRPMAVTDGARGMLLPAYGSLFDFEPDPRAGATSFAERVARYPRGTPYVLTVLEQYPDQPIDVPDLEAAVTELTGGAGRGGNRSGGFRPQEAARYNVIAGRVGEAPTFTRSDSWPFRTSGVAGALPFDVRIECWLPADTIRRMGFGRVVVGRAPALTLDRGASFVAFDEKGGVRGVEYGWAILAPERRWMIPVGGRKGQNAEGRVQRGIGAEGIMPN